MHKTFCDICGEEVSNVDIRRYKVFDGNRAVDICDKHYKMLSQLLFGAYDVKSNGAET